MRAARCTLASALLLATLALWACSTADGNDRQPAKGAYIGGGMGVNRQ